ncbi:MAG: hypothetical protein ABJF10_21310 [Chthoniobacter sp.]|uniref:hypothetical protein n=1 Tax=Chthoniobacter sp. TaxID=2510640 RepID=UPI0032A84291
MFTGPKGDKGDNGAPGSRGSAGPKDSIIWTERGNIAFSCFEGARPMVFDVYQVETISQRVLSDDFEGQLALRPDFVASAVPESLFVFSVAPDYPSPFACRIRENHVCVLTKERAARVTVVVAGIHRDFPDWDMPHKTDAQREKSRAFWGQEWR